LLVLNCDCSNHNTTHSFFSLSVCLRHCLLKIEMSDAEDRADAADYPNGESPPKLPKRFRDRSKVKYQSISLFHFVCRTLLFFLFLRCGFSVFCCLCEGDVVQKSCAYQANAFQTGCEDCQTSRGTRKVHQQGAFSFSHFTFRFKMYYFAKVIIWVLKNPMGLLWGV